MSAVRRAATSIALGLAALVAPAGCGGGGGADDGAAPDITVVDAFATEGTMALAVYLDVENPGGADRIVDVELVGASAELAERVTLHQTAERNGLSIMEPTDAIDVAGGTDEAVTPGGAHVMVEDVARAVTTADVIELTLDLDRSEDIAVDVRVVTADEAIGLLTGNAP